MSAKVILNVSGDRELKRDLAEARQLLDEPAALHQAIGQTLVNGGTHQNRRYRGVGEHITRAAVFRHRTADRLGARRSGYLEKAARGIEVIANASEFGFQIVSSAEIFSRTFKPVHVVIKQRKWLAIPCDPRTYGKSPRNFPGMLDFIELKKDLLACWVMRKKPKAAGKVKVQRPEKPERSKSSKPIKKGKMDIVFWGRKATRLPQDRELLPSDEEFLNLIDAGLNAELRRVLGVE